MKTVLADKKSWLWIIGLLIVFVGVSYAAKSDQPETYPPYTLDSPSPSGIKAVYTYLDRENVHVDEWQSPPDQLGRDGGDDQELLIMTEPAYLEDSETEHAYMDYIRSGHTVLFLKSNPDGMFGVKTTQMPTELETTVEDRYDHRYQTEISSIARLKPVADDEVLLSDDAGVVALKRSYGEGTLIAVNAPDWLTNESILEKDHLPLVLDLLDEAGGLNQDILFDTYSGSRESDTSFINVFPEWVIGLSILAIVWTVFWLWYKGKRFGRVLVPRDASVRFSDERIRALAAWYLRSRRYGDALAIQADYLKFLLQEHWGISYRRPWRDSTEILARRLTSKSEIDITVFVNDLEAALKKEQISKQEFLQWTKKIDRLRREVEA